MPKICLYVSPTYNAVFEFAMGTECYYKVIVSIFEHFNVYEDILNKYLLCQV